MIREHKNVCLPPLKFILAFSFFVTLMNKSSPWNSEIAATTCFAITQSIVLTYLKAALS